MSLPCRALILFVPISMFLGSISLHAQTPKVDSFVETTRSQLTALRDAFVKQAAKSGVSCAIRPPAIVVQDVPSFGSYDPDTNTLTSPAWEQMSTEERSIFYKGLPPGANEEEARADFEIGVHHWVIVHELGHWWEACRGLVDHGDHYAFELEADRIAAAYWTEHDPSVIAHQTAIFGAILRKWPNPVPPGQDAKSFLNANIDALVPTRDYIWFQAQMCLIAFSQKPIPSFKKALTLTNSH
jgi:hypothetical protein